MSNSTLSEAARKQRAEYYKKYRENHKEAIRRNQERYWERQAQKARNQENVESEEAE